MIMIIIMIKIQGKGNLFNSHIAILIANKMSNRRCTLANAYSYTIHYILQLEQELRWPLFVVLTFISDCKSQGTQDQGSIRLLLMEYKTTIIVII